MKRFSNWRKIVVAFCTIMGLCMVFGVTGDTTKVKAANAADISIDGTYYNLPAKGHYLWAKSTSNNKQTTEPTDGSSWWIYNNNGSYVVTLAGANINEVYGNGDYTVELKEGTTSNITTTSDEGLAIGVRNGAVTLAGTGTLNINASYSGIETWEGGSVVINRGNINITSSDVGIRSEGAVTVNGGNVTINASGDYGMLVAANINFNGGVVNATSKSAAVIARSTAATNTGAASANITLSNGMAVTSPAGCAVTTSNWDYSHASSAYMAYTSIAAGNVSLDYEHESLTGAAASVTLAGNNALQKGEQFVSGSYAYTILKNNTVEVAGFAYGKSSAKVKIANTVTVDGVTYKVTAIGKNAFYGNKKVKSVVVGNNVKKINKNAFAKCTKLKTVTLGKSVTTIQKTAFAKCTKLKTVKAATKKAATLKKFKKIFGSSVKVTKK